MKTKGYWWLWSIFSGSPNWRIFFFFANSSLRLAFLQSVEGLDLFLVTDSCITLFLVSREKEKFGPITMEKLKAWPWLASAWQKSMHLETRVELASFTAAILVFFWINDSLEIRVEWIHLLLEIAKGWSSFRCMSQHWFHNIYQNCYPMNILSQKWANISYISVFL